MAVGARGATLYAKQRYHLSPSKGRVTLGWTGVLAAILCLPLALPALRDCPDGFRGGPPKFETGPPIEINNVTGCLRSAGYSAGLVNASTQAPHYFYFAEDLQAAQLGELLGNSRIGRLLLRRQGLCGGFLAVPSVVLGVPASRGLLRILIKV